MEWVTLPYFDGFGQFVICPGSEKVMEYIHLSIARKSFDLLESLSLHHLLIFWLF